ncbi:unnamed protein product [Cochlearia groenlandica]
MRRFSINSVVAAIFSILLILVAVATSHPFEFSGNLTPFETECRGSIAECSISVDGETGTEFDMDSEINRRILAAKSYISYGALKKNSVPCSRRGASYYNCRRGAQANPYSRGCSVITRCQRST